MQDALFLQRSRSIIILFNQCYLATHLVPQPLACGCSLYHDLIAMLSLIVLTITQSHSIYWRTCNALMPISTCSNLLILPPSSLGTVVVTPSVVV